MKDGDSFNEDQLKAFADFKFDGSAAGTFNIPVCQVYDLRFFPYEADQRLVCIACHTKVAVGGKDKSKRFWSAEGAGDTLTDRIKNLPDLTQGPLGFTCPNDVYEG